MSKTSSIINFGQNYRDLCALSGKIGKFGNLAGVKHLTNSMCGLPMIFAELLKARALITQIA